MTALTRINVDPDVMGGKPCIRACASRSARSSALVAAVRTVPEILAAYPYLEEADIREAESLAAASPCMKGVS